MKYSTGLITATALALLCFNVQIWAQNGGPRGPGNGAGAARNNIDDQLNVLITNLNLSGDASENADFPSIEDPLPQLGRTLFFSKSLGGGLDSACVSCHHPSLGGADALSLPVGVDALNPDLLGAGRIHSSGLPLVPRNAPTVFNSGLYTEGLFWDSRVEHLGRNNRGGIRTPDSAFGEADPDAGDSLLIAQAKFPVTSTEEMKTEEFEAGSSNDQIRGHLAARLGDYGDGLGELSPNAWYDAFKQAFNSNLPAQELVTYASIATALGAYENSMVFVNNPWKQYVEGDRNALSPEQKAGARLFLTTTRQGGAGCVSCHSGDLFSDQRHHNVAFPQFGPGKGNGANRAGDFGRERETSRTRDRFDFRTPSLLNVAATAPYGHAGVYSTLQDVVRHYQNPRNSIEQFFDQGGACTLKQFEQLFDCAELYPTARRISRSAVSNLEREQDNGRSRLRPFRLNNREVDQVVAFLNALTDPCIEDRSCLSPWIAPESELGPDGQQLNAVNESGELL